MAVGQNGTAVSNSIPVVTIGHPRSAPGESDNWPAPARDCQDRFAEYFDRVTWLRSEDVPAEIQTFLLENRSRWPTAAFPYRQPSPGTSHPDGIPICWVD